MGSKGSNKTTSTTAPDPRAAAAYRSLLDRAEGVASLPYTPYTGELVADVNQQQNLGISGINAAANQAQPAINQALGMATRAAQPISTQDIQRYINPYIGSVVDATWNQFNNQNQQQQQQVIGNTIAQNALGGNRSAVAQAQTAGQQALAQAPVIAGLYSHGYDTAVNTALSQQQALAQGAYSVGNLGVAGQNAALTGAGAQIGAGTLQQQTQQAKDSAAYQQFVNQQAFPYQQTQWLAGIQTGVGSQLGGTSSTETPKPNPWAQIAGLGLTAASAFLKDGGRVQGLDTGGIAGTPWASSAGYIPSIGIAAGRGAPEPPKPAEQEQGQGLPSNQQMGELGGKLKGKLSSLGSSPGAPMDLGSGWAPSPNGTFMPSLTGLGSSVGFLGGIYAQGGRVPGYEDGGDVDDPNSPYNKGLLSEAADVEKVDNPDSSYNRSLRQAEPDRGLAPASPIWMPRIGSPSANATANIDARSGQFDPVGSGRIVPGGVGAGALLPPQNSNFVNAPTSGPTLDQLASTYGDAGLSGAAPKEAPPVSAGPVNVATHPSATAGVPHPGVVPAARAGSSYASWPAMEAWKRAVSSIESGSPEGDYGAVTTTKNRKGQTQRALGRFQVMEENVGDWTQQAIGQRMTPAEFLKSKWAQDQVFANRFGGYVAKYGNPEDAAAAWFAGEGGMGNPGARDPLGTTVASYRDKFNTALNKVGGSTAPNEDSGVSLAMAKDDGSQLPANATPTAGGQFPGLGWSGSSESKKSKSDEEETGGLLGALGIKLSPAVRMGLMSAGLGMMASKSPYLGTALGEGGLQGVGAYQQERQRQAQIPKIEAETRRLDAEAAKAQAEIKKLAIETEGAQYLLEGRKNLLNQPFLTGRSMQAPAAAPAAAPPPTAIPAPTRTAAPASSDMQPAAPPAPAAAPAAMQAPEQAASPSPPINVAQVEPQVASVQQTAAGPVAIDRGGRPLFNLAEEFMKAKEMQLYGAAYGIPAIEQAGTQNMRLIETMLNKGQQLTTAGGVMPIAGSAESVAREAAMKTGAEKEAGLPYDVAKARAEAAIQAGYRMKEVQPVPGGPTHYISEADLASGRVPGTVINPGAGSPPGAAFAGALGPAAKQPAFFEKGQEAIAKDMEDMTKQFQARQLVRERLLELQDIMKVYESGHWAEEKAGLIARARALGIPVPNFDTANPEKYQEFIKNQTANIFDQVKAIGGRVLVSEIEGLARANASPTMQPEANRMIIGQAMGLLNYEDKYFNDFVKWHGSNPYATQDDRAAYDANWVANTPLRPFTQEAQRNTPVKGEAIPEPKAREVGRVYMTPKGAARWNGSAWEKAQ